MCIIGRRFHLLPALLRVCSTVPASSVRYYISVVYLFVFCYSCKYETWSVKMGRSVEKAWILSSSSLVEFIFVGLIQKLFNKSKRLSFHLSQSCWPHQSPKVRADICFLLDAVVPVDRPPALRQRMRGLPAV